MKKYFFTLGIFSAGIFSIVANAATSVQLNMRLNLNGQEITPTAVTPYGKSTVVSQATKTGKVLEITVTPTATESTDYVTNTADKTDLPNATGVPLKRSKEAKDSKNTAKIVTLNFVIAEYANGKKIIIGNSKIITHLGAPATVSESKKGKQTFELQVTPTEVTVGNEPGTTK